MHSSTLRLLWSAIEETQGSTLISLSDTHLTHYLLERLQSKIFLSSEECNDIKCYLSTKTVLIRDLVDSRLN
jgi:hypothetical protein